MEDLTQATPPCRIHMKDGHIFQVVDVNSWEAQDFGIYAEGYWAFDDVERALLFSHDEIKYIEMDYAALRAWQSAQMQPPQLDVDLRGEPEQEAA